MMILRLKEKNTDLTVY